MRQIEVVAAIIVKDHKVFATQRGYGEWKDFWEFPGGKIDAGETPEEALCREIKEELDTEIAVGELFTAINYDYPTFHITMHCYLCTIENGSLTLLEHEAAKWLSLEQLYSVTWLPADLLVIAELQKPCIPFG